METGILHLHSFIPYILLLLLVVTTVKAFMGLSGNKPYTKLDNKLSLFTLIFTHTQVLVGLALYFQSSYYLTLKEIGMGEAMKDDMIRKMAVEHPITMILAAVLITIGRSKSKKKEEDKAKHKMVAIFFGIGLILILSQIPWQNWLA